MNIIKSYKYRIYPNVKQEIKFAKTFGNIQDMKLSDRIFECVSCGFKLNRDHQAAIVIRNKTVGVNADKRSWSDSKTLHHLVVVKQLHRSDYHIK